MPLIYLDPGHGENAKGSYDPGAVGSGGTRENDVVLDVCKRLGNILRLKGFHTAGEALEATQDRESLREAVDAANEYKAALFVSVHANAGPPSAHGYEVLYATSEGHRLADCIGDEIGRQVVRGESAWLVKPVPLTNRGLKPRRDLYVLTKTHMPAVLVELAFISNPNEENLLNNKYVRQAMAQAIADGIAAFLQK